MRIAFLTLGVMLNVLGGDMVKAAAQPLVLRTVSQEANTLKFDPTSQAAPGFSVELIRELKQLDSELEFTGLERFYSTRRIEVSLQANSIDVFFGLIKTPERMGKMDFLENPALYTQYGQFAVNKSDKVKIRSFEDIRALGKDGAIGVPQGSAFVEYLKAQKGLIVYDSDVSVVATLKMLLLKRIRFVYFGGAVLDGYLKNEHMEDQVTILPTRFNTEDVFVVVSKTLPSNARERLNTDLLKLQRAGVLERLRSLYHVD